ncbi:MAG: type I polyketide synthase [Alphaproteobacteria bacterium]|nr:type I polyketide synthase [Alphaproteobacteria bacterium]
MSVHEPIAIVGIGCRFPGGATGPDGYWQLIERCGDAVREVPADRWSTDHVDPDPRTPGRSYTARAAFLDEPGRAFDASYFGISPREAETLDPQQRLLLEVAVEACEDAGVPLHGLRGSRTGVFVGGFTLDSLLLRFSDLDAVDAHTATSSSMTVLSNRLSYTFDLRGPSMTVDTACSSSLVATHLACRALRNGDCVQALVGGVNVMLLPNFGVVMCKGRFLAPDGRSKAFDAAADGYGRGEGAGMVLLEPLSKAIAAGHRVYAVLRGTGVNQDGATDGMPQPSGRAQAELFRAVCDEAGLSPSDVGYVEAHGTGTALGDLTEVGALGEVYGRPGEGDAPRIGSVKPNIGHQEAAAGIAGLIKATLAVHHGVLPGHFPPRTVNPALRLDEVGLVLPAEAASWTAERRVAAVNSFGYGGTNAHALVEQAPPVDAPAGGRVRALALTGAGPEALRARAAQVAALPVEAVAGALAHRTNHLPTRAVVLASMAAEGLAALAEGRAHPGVVGPEAASSGVAWLFTGMGPQWWHMGAELYRTDDAFRHTMCEAIGALADHGIDLWPELFQDRERSRMARNDVAQPANFALQVGLVGALRARGLRPDVIVGHSTGEMAAAWAAGALTLDEAARVVAVRARLQQEVAGGGMLAVGCGAEEVRGDLERIGGLEIAAYNADDAVTVAGGLAELAALEEALTARGTWCGRVRVQVAYHSAHMDPIGDRLVAELAGLTPRAPSVPLVSTVTGERVERPTHDGAYWWRNTRGAVRLADAVRTAAGLGVDTVLEVGPHPVLGPSVRAASGGAIVTLFALRRQEPEEETLLRAMAGLWVRGADLDPTVFADDARAELPRYPWQRRELWREPLAVTRARQQRPGAHPFLREPQGDGAAARIDGSVFAWLRDHVVRDVPLLPGAAFVEAARAAVAECSDGQVVVLGEIALERALALEEPGTAQRLRTTVRDGRVVVEARSGEGDWVRNATALVEEARRWRALGAVDLVAARAACAEEVDVEALYAELARRGLRYGPAFRALRRVWRGEGEVLAELDADVAPDLGFALHPSVLDGAFQALLALVGDARTRVPVGIERLVAVDEPLPRRVWVHARLRDGDGEDVTGDLVLADDAGRELARVVGLQCHVLAARTDTERWRHRTAWSEVAPRGQRADARRVFEAGPSADAVGLDLLEALRLEVLRCAADGVGLDVCTRGAVPVGGIGGDPAHAALWGLARVARTEHPELGLRLIDLDPRGDDAQAVVAALAADDGEEEVAVRGAARHVARLCRLAAEDPLADVREVPAGSVSARMIVGSPGAMDSLVFVPAPRPAPGPGEVEIEVEAVPLHFKDVMKAMGMLDEVALEATYLGSDLGMEALGTVSRTGEGCSLRVGDRVLVYKGGCMRSHVVADERFVVACPSTWGVDDAAGFFVSVTAWHSLVEVARLRAGETVLVQSAAGGVGLAAVGIARRLGATVIGTAGTEEKRAHLRRLGVEHVLDSRTLDFGDDVRRLTGGRGVDVVLNSLGGRAIDVGLGCLAPGGRFVELGKRDLAEGRPISLAAFNRRVSLHAVDLDRGATEDPDAFGPLARTVLAELVAGRLDRLPVVAMPADRAEEAFRLLGSGACIGKVALSLREGTLRLAPIAGGMCPSPGRSWLVTGGLGGFGLATAGWLASQGVTHLVLAGRRGEAQGEERAIVERLAREVAVEQVALDVSDAAAVDALVARLQASDAPLGGVIHAAAVLEDGPLASTDEASLRRVMAAKALGAVNLDRATRNVPLEAFVMYGSISARVGNPGQGAYAAANTALEGVAASRRAAGLPATVAAWGVLGEVGMVARDPATGAHLRAVGLTPMAPAEALDALGACLAAGGADTDLVDIDWTTWTRAHPAVPWQRLAELVDAEDAGPVGLRQALEALPAEERLPHAVSVLAQAAAPVFGLDVDALEPGRPLRDLGLDSLMAVELAAALGRVSGSQISAMDLLGGRSLLALAQRLAGDAPSTPRASAPLTAEAVRQRVLLTAPYDRLLDVRFEGERALAEVEPDVLDDDLGPVAAAEAGRHLAILGSFAAVLRNPEQGRFEYAVASADLVIHETEGSPMRRVRLTARCTSFDAFAGSARSEGELRAPDGRLLASLTVSYHVLPVHTLRAVAPSDLPEAPVGHEPYARWTPAPVVAIDRERVTLALDAVDAADCAGHFPGLPALPVSILGRHVFAAVAAAQRAATGDDGLRVEVLGARLATRRFVWAGEPVRFEATPDGRCEVWTGDELAASFELEVRVRRGLSQVA